MRSNDPVADRAQARLNFDVLRLVCNDLTEVSDVLSFALTCSALRKGALQRRLRMSPVILSRPDSVERFHKFIFADPTSRSPYLYGLSISPDLYSASYDDPSCIECLPAILEAATHLEYLSFSTALGYSVCTAIAKMATLRELVVHSDWRYHTPHEPEALKNLLTALRSPLQHLSIADYETRQVSASFVHYHLFQFAPTLESLGLEQFPFDISPSAVTTPFTALRSLRINETSYRSHFYRLDILLRLFPNLDDTLYLKGFMPPVDQYSVLREQSREAQRDYTWTRLDRVNYSAELAFMMALRCPIRCMEIDGPVLQETPFLAVALRDNCPRHLLLPISFFGHDDLQKLDALFPPEAAEKLTHLVLFAEINVNQRRRPMGEWNNFCWSQFIDSLVGSMKHLRLTHLRIIFHQSVLPPSKSDPPAGSSGIPESEEDFAPNTTHHADLYLAALRRLDTMQTLRYVFLTTCGVCQYSNPRKCWHSSKAWQVVPGQSVGGATSGGPGQPSDTELDMSPFVEICDKAAEKVIDEEELHMGHREEGMVSQCVENSST